MRRETAMLLNTPQVRERIHKLVFCPSDAFVVLGFWRRSPIWCQICFPVFVRVLLRSSGNSQNSPTSRCSTVARWMLARCRAFRRAEGVHGHSKTWPGRRVLQEIICSAESGMLIAVRHPQTRKPLPAALRWLRDARNPIRTHS